MLGPDNGYTLARMPLRLAISMLLLILAGCSDVATRIRYTMLDALGDLEKSKEPSTTVTLRPDHWPDACPGRGYRLTISPFKGGKQVKTGDITIACKGGRTYYTGLGSEKINVPRELTIEKRSDEALRVTLRKSATGVDLVALE